MLDAQINYDDVEMGVACYCYGDTTSGQGKFEINRETPHALTLQHRTSRRTYLLLCVSC